MAGNVTEWCMDEYAPDYYSWSPSRNPYGPTEWSGVKVLRGGAWNHPGPGDFAIRRGNDAENKPYTGYGFRVVREIEPAPSSRAVMKPIDALATDRTDSRIGSQPRTTRTTRTTRTPPHSATPERRKQAAAVRRVRGPRFARREVA